MDRSKSGPMAPPSARSAKHVDNEIHELASPSTITNKGGRRPYAPQWRVSPPGCVTKPLSQKDMHAWKLGTHNPLRLEQEDARTNQHVPCRRPRHSDSRTSDEAAGVATHYNKRQDVGLKARELSPIIALKRFNNWIKSSIISLHTPRVKAGPGRQGIRVLDLGCGKGGDLRKWSQHRISDMVMIDIAEVSVQQASMRYKEGRYAWPAHFYTCDAFRTPLDQVVPAGVLSPMFDVVSMQFCLHYGWDSEASARTMLSNVARWLRPGGSFIGTIPDDDTLFGRLHALEDPAALKFGNENYSVEFDERLEPGAKPFGNKYYFWLNDAVDNVPEYVVDWATLETCVWQRKNKVQATNMDA
ncbi:hypothetical protein MGL_2068 [Malassezia globosa CBS 7966]|uniref:mRNA cap guanine-N(7) methyltransferase n=1 Tax=Malassezia globosa (strain ATCC MYA-4612 / CBS 7966) TaxID=425265 RepID=A8Q0Q8_MALGO|nr:uncharacterized protein MGL_2068 [Malassezia globosa CBS 7966]EDP43855.1 hypothetical protein MGL_2068 [Malassezia globosa CBS 7966]